jgi:hypothetical protein
MIRIQDYTLYEYLVIIKITKQHCTTYILTIITSNDSSNSKFIATFGPYKCCSHVYLLMCINHLIVIDQLRDTIIIILKIIHHQLYTYQLTYQLSIVLLLLILSINIG